MEDVTKNLGRKIETWRKEEYNWLKSKKEIPIHQNKKLRIKKISEMIGFRDPYYFSRIFRKLCGISPQKFREQQ
ncbi:MAG TPA: hypothetical protein DC049_08345 [Spirochaetia bacterium]|nr:hypothetical protein [Spirochaetia bacterium]